MCKKKTHIAESVDDVCVVHTRKYTRRNSHTLAHNGGMAIKHISTDIWLALLRRFAIVTGEEFVICAQTGMVRFSVVSFCSCAARTAHITTIDCQ